MLNVEDFLRRQRKQEKLQSLLFASVRVSESDIRQKFIDQNIKFEADYIFFDPNQLVKADEVKLTEDDLRRSYNERADEYKLDATRKLRYVSFPESPSHDDTANVISEMDDVAKRARSGADFADLAKTSSETPSPDIFIKHGGLSPDRETAVFAAKAGDIIGPTNESDGYHLIKVLEFHEGKEEFIRASHILINIQNNDSSAALKTAKDLYARVKRGEDFAELAKKYSTDAGSGVRGGDVGWFGKGRMVKPFEDAAFKTRKGQTVGPVRSQFGYHIIKVLDKDNREVKFTDIHMSIRTSQQTKNAILQQAQDFSYLAKQGDFAKEALQSKYNVSETPPFQKNATIPGIGMNPVVSKFAFGNKVGEVSEPISLQSGYGVFIVSETKEAGIRPFEEVKASIEIRLKREKNIEKVKAIAGEMLQALAPGDSLRKISAKRPDLPVQHLAPFTLEGFIPGIGRDLAFIGGISSLNVGEISKPIEGQRGVYLAKLTGKSPFDSSAFNAQKEQLRSQLLSEKRNQFFTEWSDQLKKASDIVDNRDLFYR